MLLTMLVTYIPWSGVLESVESVVVSRSIGLPPLSGSLWFSARVILSTVPQIGLGGAAEEKLSCTRQVLFAEATVACPVTSWSEQAQQL